MQTGYVFIQHRCTRYTISIHSSRSLSQTYRIYILRHIWIISFDTMRECITLSLHLSCTVNLNSRSYFNGRSTEVLEQQADINCSVSIVAQSHAHDRKGQVIDCSKFSKQHKLVTIQCQRQTITLALGILLLSRYWYWIICIGLRFSGDLFIKDMIIWIISLCLWFILSKTACKNNWNIEKF